MKQSFVKNRWYYLGGILILFILLFEAKGEGDFHIFMSASKDLLAGKNIYTELYHEWYHYYYNIVFALILAPFSFVPFYLAKLFWLLLNVFFVYRTWKIIRNWLPVETLTKKGKVIFYVLTFLIMLRFLRDNFHTAQMTILILYLSLEGLNLIDQRKIVWGSFLIALAIDIKLLPILLIIYLVYRNQWKAALLVVGFIVVLLFLPAIFIGVDYNNFLLAERWDLINPSNHEHVLDTTERSFHSLTSLLATLLVENSGDTYALPVKRNIADISLEKLGLVINVCRLGLIVFALYFLRSWPFKASSNNLQKLYELSYIFLVIPLIFPHQQHYAFYFIFPAVAYVVYFFVSRFILDDEFKKSKNFLTKKITFIAALAIIYFLTNSHFILGTFKNFYDHFKTLTYGILLLLLVLALCRPKKLKLD